MAAFSSVKSQLGSLALKKWSKATNIKRNLSDDLDLD